MRRVQAILQAVATSANPCAGRIRKSGGCLQRTNACFVSWYGHCTNSKLRHFSLAGAIGRALVHGWDGTENGATPWLPGNGARRRGTARAGRALISIAITFHTRAGLGRPKPRPSPECTGRPSACTAFFRAGRSLHTGYPSNCVFGAGCGHG